MQTVRVLHCGDLHFDTPFRGLSVAEAEKRKEDLRETFGQIIERVKAEKIQLLLISGDFFDNHRVMKMTLDHIIKKFNEISDTQIFISPGNHDHYHEKSFYHLIQWPKNVHIFKNHLEGVKIPRLNTTVYGIGFSKSHERESLIRNFRADGDGFISIMVLHGDVVGIGQSSDYNPITQQEIGNTHVDYLALGHRHGYSGIKKDGETYWSYSGNPEGRGFDETGAKGILIGEIGKGFCNLRFEEICKRKYMEQRIDITGDRTYEDIIQRIDKQIDDPHRNKHIYRILLVGEVEGGFTLHKAVIEEKLKDYFHYVKIVDDTKIKIDYEGIENNFSLKGIFVRNMMEKIAFAKDGDQRKKLEMALKLGMIALEQKEVVIE